MMTPAPRARTKASRRRNSSTDGLGEALASTLERFFRGRPVWHGALWPHVSNLTVEQALWRPAPDRHCIWEIVRHIIFWRFWLLEHAAGRRIEDWKEQNWTLPPHTSDSDWQADLSRLRSVHRSLTHLFRSTSSRLLLSRDATGKFPKFRWIGVMAHDSYHTGQISSLRALMGLKPIE